MPSDIAAAFERAPLLAERVAARVDPNDPIDHVIAIAREELSAMSEAQRIAVLDAHPRIGGDSRALSALSRSEQGEDVGPAVLATLNDEYERKFGFRFVVFVAGRNKAQIIPILRSRLTRSRDAELAAAVEEFLAITRDRLSKGPL